MHILRGVSMEKPTEKRCNDRSDKTPDEEKRIENEIRRTTDVSV
jgi:hypothetical protein